MQHRNTACGLALAAAFALTSTSARAQTGTPGAETQQAPPAAQPAPPSAGDTSAVQATAASPGVETRYTLTQVAGKPLPVEVEKEWRCREEVTAATLTLRGDRWHLETSKRETCGDRTKEERDTDDGIYRNEGGTLRFLDDDGRENEDDDRDEIDLDEMRTGTTGADGTLTVELADGNRLVFRPDGR